MCKDFSNQSKRSSYLHYLFKYVLDFLIELFAVLLDPLTIDRAIDRYARRSISNLCTKTCWAHRVTVQLQSRCCSEEVSGSRVAHKQSVFYPIASDACSTCCRYGTKEPPAPLTPQCSWLKAGWTDGTDNNKLILGLGWTWYPIKRQIPQLTRYRWCEF